MKLSAASSVHEPTKAARPRFDRIAGRRVPLLLRFLFVVLAVSVGWWGVVQGPWYQNRMFSKMSLPELMHQVKTQKNNPTYLYWFGKRLNESGQFKPASVVLSRACNLDQNSARLRSEWTKALLGTGMVTSAFNQLKQFVGTHPHLADAHFLLGRFYYTQREMQLCKAEMQQATAIDPSSARSWAYLSGAEEQLQQHGPALYAARKAVQLDGSQPDYHVALGLLLEDAHQNSKAQREFARAASLAPHSEVPHLTLANLYKSEGNVTDAAEQASTAVDLAPNDANALLVYGSLLLQQNQAAKAVTILQRAAVVDRYNAEIAKQLEIAYRAVGNSAMASFTKGIYEELADLAINMNAAQAAVAADPTKAVSQLKLANLLAETGDISGALIHFSAAMHNPPDSPQVLDAAATALLRFKHMTNALQLAQRAEHAAAGSPAAHETLGNVDLEMGQLGKAEQEYNSVINWLPGKKRELVARVAAFKKQQANMQPAALSFEHATQMQFADVSSTVRYHKSLTFAQQAVRLNPTNPLYCQYLMGLQIRGGDTSAALRTATKLLALEPDTMRIRATYAELLAESNQPAVASLLKHQLSILAIYPDARPTVWFIRGVVALNKHQPAVAITMLKRSLAANPNSRQTFLYLSHAQAMMGDAAGAAISLRQYKAMVEGEFP